MLHQFEALFALMLAQFQPLPHWIYLTEYKTDEIKKKAQLFADRDYGAVSNGSSDSQAGFVMHAVYPGVDPSTANQQTWNESVSDIGWLIEEGAKRYLANPEYNAYKHGLRVLPGSMTLMVGIGSGKELKPVMNMASSVTYLERETAEEGIGFAEVTKEVKAEDAYQWILAMSSLAEMIKNVRLAGFRQTPIQISTVKIDRIGLTRLKPVSTFRMSL